MNPNYFLSQYSIYFTGESSGSATPKEAVSASPSKARVSPMKRTGASPVKTDYIRERSPIKTNPYRFVSPEKKATTEVRSTSPTKVIIDFIFNSQVCSFMRIIDNIFYR